MVKHPLEVAKHYDLEQNRIPSLQDSTNLTELIHVTN